MKTRIPWIQEAVLPFLLVTAPVWSVDGQGTIEWGNAFGMTNSPTALRARIYGPDVNDPFISKQGNTAAGLPAGTQTYNGPLLAGTGFMIQICTLVSNTFIGLDHTYFRTGSVASGFIFSRVARDPYHPAGSTITAVMRAWDNQGGTITSWSMALAATNTAIGESDPFPVIYLGGFIGGGGPDPVPARTDRMRSFNIYHRVGAFITTQPSDVIGPAGSNAQMKVEVASRDGPPGPPSFQWQREGADIAGATGSTFDLPNIQYTDAGNYRVLVTFSSLSLTSRVARLTVPPMIAAIDHIYFPDWGADAVRLSYDSTPLHPVRVEVRSTLRDNWVNMGQFVNPTVRGYFYDIGPTNDQRFYRLSIDP